MHFCSDYHLYPITGWDAIALDLITGLRLLPPLLYTSHQEKLESPLLLCLTLSRLLVKSVFQTDEAGDVGPSLPQSVQ